ncbi:DUF2182 domain-containing protein [Oerskovia flava]|uniref:copper chaperone n=1 Tax=Oerskovia flava TaxID=2986422 RepID=UPI0022405C04|nr:DUF2182 domain-containing protein [Oerskovia sp. JB1-3-2]
MRARHPEIPLLVAAAAAWVPLAVALWWPGTGGEPPGAWAAVGHPGHDGAPTPAADLAVAVPPGGAGSGALAGVAVGFGLWTLMVAAMMLPGLVPAARYAAFVSDRRRRQRTIALLAAGYAAAWAPLGVVVAVAHALAPVLVPASWWPLVVAVLLVGAALWQLGGPARRALRACHRTLPVRYTGRAADRSAVRYGWHHGVVCLRLCGPLMAAVAVAGHPLLLTVAAALVVWSQKLVRGAESARPAIATGLVLTAVVVVTG